MVARSNGDTDRESGTSPQAALINTHPGKPLLLKNKVPLKWKMCHLYQNIFMLALSKSFKLSLEHVTHPFAYLWWSLNL